MDLRGLGGAYTTQTFFCVLTWCFGTSHTCEHNVLHLPSFWTNNFFSPTTLLLSSHHGVPPWMHHALLAWLSCLAFLLAHKLMIASILTIHLEWWSLSPFFSGASHWNNFVPNDLPHTHLIFSLLNCFLQQTWLSLWYSFLWLNTCGTTLSLLGL
jgi:hypothetical protein